MTVQEEERRRVARELHDDIGQRAAVLSFAIERLRDQPSVRDVATLQDELGKLITNVSDLAECLRDVAHRLHPSVLEDLGLPTALKSLVDEQREHGQEVTVAIRDLPTDVPLPTALALYRITQEALRNAAKHASGAPVRVKLELIGTDLRLMIEDAGRGFDLRAAQHNGGLGLMSCVCQVLQKGQAE